MPGRIDFSFLLGGQPSRESRRQPEDPFRILVVGDFAGGAADDGPPAPRRVDLDSFDALFTRLQPRASMEFGAQSTTIAFRNLDDFHPDSLLQRVPALAALREEARQLQDPARSRTALAGWQATTKTEAPAAPPTASAFEQLLGAPRRPPQPAAGLDGWLTELVRPHLAPIQDPRTADLLASLDLACARSLRELLVHPDFQQREATWRGLYWLLQNIECDEDLQVAVFDASAKRLGAMLAADDLRTSPLHALLADRAGADHKPFSLVVVMHGFGPGEQDARTLAALGALAEAGGAAVVATGEPALLGFPSWTQAPDPKDWKTQGASDAWRSLRASPQAKHLALVLPRFLLRLPYGAKTDRIDSFAFEEMPEPPVPGAYLWGAPGLAVAMLLANAFRSEGWQFDVGVAREVPGLPLHTFQRGGQAHVQPCAEVLLGERALAAAVAAGLCMLQSHANRDAARMAPLRSIAAVADTPLAGPWGN